MSKSKVLRISFVVATVALLATPGTAAARSLAEGPPATMDVDADVVTWEPEIENGGLVLRIGGPCGFQLVQGFEPEGPAVFYAEGLDDGAYRWHLLLLPVDGQEPSDDPTRGLESGCDPLVDMSGTLTVVNERFVPPEEEEEGRQSSQPMLRAPDDIVHYDDVIIDGSLCVGFDCQNGESFGYDTIILKEHNLRIYFKDTSYYASYPTNDWRISVNSSANGGGSYFSIDDVDEGTSPFRIEADAPSYSLYVEDSGQIGVGTSTPYVEMHIKDGDTPTVRLHQDSSVGFSAQTWDVAGNESNFFVRDVTNGSLLPFRIKPGAPSSSLTILDDGDVGIGTWSPDAALHIVRSSVNPKLAIEKSGGDKWVFNVASGGLRVVANGATTAQALFETSGDLVLDGYLTENSDVNAKQDFVAVDGAEVLVAVADLPITTWSYKDEPGVRHLGPMAQDFHAAFGLGDSDMGIATLDTSGVALAAIQALQAENAELEARLAALEGSQPASFMNVLPWLLLAVAMLGVGLALGRRASKQVCK